MSKKEKIKSATKRVNKSKSNKFWSRVWNIIRAPFRLIARACKKLWNWICTINLIGLLNITLLVAIIVLFAMLIIDVINARKTQTVVVAEPVQVTQQINITEETNIKAIATLPLSNNDVKSVNVVPVKRAELDCAKRQTAHKGKKFWGDVIVDSRAAGAMLQNNTQVNGNVYLQNMRKYTLPCDIQINGNLFLRDVNMLQFCGDFIITGNIYVSPRSSFGPIPKTARLGGHVVL